MGQRLASGIAAREEDWRDAAQGRRSVAGRSPRPVVCFPFVNDALGGSHISALHLMRHLDRRRFEPLVVLHRTTGPVADVFRREGISFEPAPSEWVLSPGRRPHPLPMIKEMMAIGGFLRQRGVAIVHTNDGPTHCAWALPARLVGAKVVWHHRRGPDARGLRYLAPWVAHDVVAVSRFAIPQRATSALRRKCTVIRSPFDAGLAATDRGACRRMLLDELGLASDVRVVAYVGNLVQRKRPLVFVDAISALARRSPSFPFIGLLFGEPLEPGIEAAVLARAAASGVADRIRLMGFRYPPERWLGACDALLVPAVDEPFGRTLIEAMLVGTLVIAADSGGNPEAIRHGETGVLVPPDDAAGFADHLERLGHQPDWARAIAVTAQAEALDRFGVDRHAEAIMGIYDRLLQRAAA